MRQKAEPCLRDYLTIHVPASTLMGDRLKKKKQVAQDDNPLMNKKLQVGKKNGVSIIYSTQPNKSFGKKRKMESIPLLSNFKLNEQNKLRVVKDLRKTEYNFVFQKNKPKIQWIDRKHQGAYESPRQISSSHQNKNLSRSSLQSNMAQRQSTPSLIYSQNSYNRLARGSHYFQSSDFITKRADSTENKILISGYRAHICDNLSNSKKSSGREGNYDIIMGQKIYITN